MSSFRMSADLFRTRDFHPHNSTSGLTEINSRHDSRIPVASPGSFRRCQSLRLRGERYCGRSCVHSASNGRLSNHTELSPTEPPSASHIAAPGGDAAPRGRINTEQAGGAHNARIRSLSLSFSSPRLSTYTSSHLYPGGRVVSVPGSVPGGGGTGPQQGVPGAHQSPRTPPTSPDGRSYLDDDLESLRSYASVASTASCDHPFVAHNGTTFSGRRMKYVVHCSTHAGQGDEYLTPTQRAQKQIKRLKNLLQQAKQDIEQKDSDIFRLTKEVVELRVYKTLHSPEDKSNSSEAVTVRENATDDMKTPDSPTCTDFTDDAKTPFEKSVVDMQSSFADSGHFEDLHTSKDSVVATCDKAVLARLEPDVERRLVEMYEKKLEDLVRLHVGETHELKQKHNDKIEELLQRLSDVNIRYCQLVPNYEQARDKIQELEKQLDDVNRQLQDQEEKNKQLYLQMYNKGVEVAKLEQKEQVLALAQSAPSRVSVSELLQQLQVTQTELENIKDTEFMAEHSPQAQSLLSAKEAVSLWVLGARKAMYRRLVELKNSKSDMDPEITLQFLKSAIYYFLTDKENHQGHLRAIQSILGFSPSEITIIDKARTS